MSASEEKTLYQINFYEGTVDLQIILFSKKYHNVKNYSVTPKVSIMQKSYCYMYVIVILSKKLSDVLKYFLCVRKYITM